MPGSTQEERERAASALGASVFSNDLILDKIFSFLDVQDLKHYRLVSHEWNLKATPELCERELYINNDMLKSKGMPELLECIQSSQNFPLTGIHFNTPICTLTSTEVLRFFRVFGLNFRYLIIETNFPPVETFADALRPHMPNIEHVEINQLEFAQRRFPDSRLFPEGLSKLRKLKVGAFALSRGERNYFLHAIQSISAVSTKLEEIQVAGLEMIKLVGQEGKLHLISACSVGMQNGGIMWGTSLGESEIPPYLEAFQFNSWGPQATTPLECISVTVSIMRANERTLKELRTPQLNFYPGFQDTNHPPSFPKLRFLEFTDSAPGYDINDDPETVNLFRFLPQNIAFNAVFPNVKSMRIGCKAWCEKRVRLLFPEDNFDVGDVEAFSSVTSVELTSAFDEFGVHVLETKFPAIESLKVNCSLFYGSRAERLIFGLKLKELDLWGVSFHHYPTYSLDSLLTGIDEDDCESLRSSGDEVRGLGLRKSAFLAQLTCLTRLKISFQNVPGSELHPLAMRNFFSKLSDWYAFRLMPKLRVCVAFDLYHPSSDKIRTALEPIAHRITFVHGKKIGQVEDGRVQEY